MDNNFSHPQISFWFLSFKACEWDIEVVKKWILNNDFHSIDYNAEGLGFEQIFAP